MRRPLSTRNKKSLLTEIRLCNEIIVSWHELKCLALSGVVSDNCITSRKYEGLRFIKTTRNVILTYRRELKI